MRNLLALLLFLPSLCLAQLPGSTSTSGCTLPAAFNYDADATIDDGSCFSPSCVGNPDSTSYILHLNHDAYLFWGNNAAYIYDPSTGDTLLSAGYNNDLYTPDFEATVVDAYWEFCIPNDACLNFSGGGGSPAFAPLWYILDFSGNVIHDGTLGVYDIGFGSSIETCVSGCTLPPAINYNADATIDDGSCVICDNNQLGLYLTLQDDFATGWSPGNDYYVVSEETGDTVLTGTMAAGATTIEVLNCLDIGCYTFSTGPIFTTEGWAISDNLGQEYAALTYGPTEGYLVAFGGTDFTDCALPGCTNELANNYNLSAVVDDNSCEFPPTNDNPETAHPIACGLILTGSLANSNGDEYSGTTVLGNAISNSGAIWYEFNADNDYQVTFNTCASADTDNGVTDTDVIVFAVGTDGSLTAIATNDDSGVAGCGLCTTGTFNSIVSINALQGNNYLVRVSQNSSNSTQTGIMIEANCALCPDGFPLNNNSNAALPIIFANEYTGSTCCSEFNDIDISGLSATEVLGVWYSFAPSYSSFLTIETFEQKNLGYAIFHLNTGVLANLTSGLIVPNNDQPSCYSGNSILGSQAEIALPSIETDELLLFLWNPLPENCGFYNFVLSDGLDGCMDQLACNYNELATDEDGSCEYVSCSGCMDENACNFDETSTNDDGSCTYPDVGYDCSGNCLNDSDGDGVCNEEEVAGCLDPNACNYDDIATDYDSSLCDYNCYGCTDETASNYDINATYDDESCIYTIPVTFAVDMSLQESIEEVYISGGGLDGWCGTCIQMFDSDDDNVYEVTLNLSSSMTYEYKFNNGGWENPEDLNPADHGECTVTDQGFTNRILEVPDGVSSFDVNLVCFGMCDQCDAVESCNNIGDYFWSEYELGVYPEETSLVYGLESEQELVLHVPEFIIDPGSGLEFVVNGFEVLEHNGLPSGLDLQYEDTLILGGHQSCYPLSGIPAETGSFEVTLTGILTVDVLGSPFTLNAYELGHYVVVEPNPNPIVGCTYPGSLNYFYLANVDDGLCIIAGCTDPTAINFHPVCNVSDDSCIYNCFEVLCATDINNDSIVGVGDLLILLGDFGSACIN